MPGTVPNDPRRRNVRHKTEFVSCELGEVVDLSRGGLRVRGSGRLPLRQGQVGSLRLGVPEGSVPVRARVAWVSRRGLRKYELGLEFVDLDAKTAKALETVARFGFVADDLDDDAHRAPGAPGGPGGPARVSVLLDLPDYYELLGVSPAATPDQIAKAYRGLARKWHPDVNAKPDARDKFIELQEAYDTLRDPGLRAAYDHRRQAA